MYKKLLFVIIPVLLISGIVLLVSFNSLFKSKEDMKIGKPLYLEIDQHQIADYKIIEDITLWDKNQRDILIKYMKKNNLKIKPGKYTFNQATSFEKSLKIFEFEKLN